MLIIKPKSHVINKYRDKKFKMPRTHNLKMATATILVNILQNLFTHIYI